MTLYFLINDAKREYSIEERINDEEKFNKKNNHPIRYYEITRYIDIPEFWAARFDELTPDIKEYLVEGFNLNDYKLCAPVKRSSYNNFSQRRY